MNNKILLMKMLFSLLSFLFAACVHSQEVVDTVSVRVQYRALYKHTQEQKEAYDDRSGTGDRSVCHEAHIYI